MRIFNRLLTAAGVLALLTGIALTADKPAVITAEQGTGPAGVVESTLDFYPQEPEWTGPPRTTKPLGLKKETPEEKALMERLKNLQLDVGHELATVLQAPPLSRGGADGIAAAPSLGTNFEGITMTSSGGFIPPDPIMAAGPNHLIQAVNLRWTIYSKTGTAGFTTSFSSWFSSVNTRSEGFSDPKVVYDHYAGRWIVMCIGFNDAAQVGSYFISVSDDSDPNGFWYKWATPGEKNGDIVTTNFPDYPGIGYDSSEAVYLTSRQFPLPSGSFQYAKVRVLKKSELYRTDSLAPALTYSDFVNMTDLTTGTNVLTMDPAMCWGPIQGNFVVGSVNFSGSAHDIWKINNPAGAATMTRVATATLGAFSAPPNASQPPGCATLINTVDARITGEVTYRSGHLYYTFNHAHNFGSGTVAAIRYVKVDTAGGVVDNIIYGADGEHMYFPNVTVTQAGGVGIGYSHSSTTSFASARYVGNFPADLAQGILKAGEGVYCLVGGGRNRWGDYSGCVLDPTFPRRVWVYNEFASSSNSWRTWAGFFNLQNHNPVIADPGPQTIDEGDTLVLNMTAADPDGENIASFTILNPKPTWAAFTNLGGGNGQLKLTPGFFDGPSIDTVRLRTTDNAVPALADTIIIEITVQEKNAAPLVAITPGDTVKLNQCQTAELLVTSSDPDTSGAVSIFPGSVPGFALVTDSGSGTGGVALAPIETDLGDYTVQVASSDGNDTTTVSLPVHVYPKGDLNRDDLLTATDIVLQLNCVFLGTPPLAGGDSCDLDGGGAASTDVVQLLNAVFLGTPLPPC